MMASSENRVAIARTRKRQRQYSRRKAKTLHSQRARLTGTRTRRNCLCSVVLPRRLAWVVEVTTVLRCRKWWVYDLIRLRSPEVDPPATGNRCVPAETSKSSSQG